MNDVEHWHRKEPVMRPVTLWEKYVVLPRLRRKVAQARAEIAEIQADAAHWAEIKMLAKEDELPNKAGRESEAELVSKIIAYLKLRGWLVTHFRPCRTEQGWRTAVQGDKGFPDLCAARAGRVIFIETKVEDKTVTKDQRRWGIALGDNYRLIYPSDFLALVEWAR